MAHAQTKPVEDWRHRVALAGSRVRADLVFAGVDSFIVVGAYSMALTLRLLDSSIGSGTGLWHNLLEYLPLIVLVHLATNVAIGAYGHIWEYASIAEARQVVVSNAVAGAILLASIQFYRQLIEPVGPIPVSLPIVGSLFAMLGMGLVRFRSRLFSFRRSGGARPRTLVVGTGRSAASFVRDAEILPVGADVVGFVAESRTHLNQVRRLAGRSILGTVDDLASLISDLEVDDVVVAGSAALVRDVVDRCVDVDARLRILPDTNAVLNGTVGVQDLRDVEFTDLLDRPAVHTDLDAVGATLTGRVVLVTGAGGSIGSEVVRQVLQFDPHVVIAVDQDETLLHEAGLRWRSDRVTPVLCDIRKRSKLLQVFAEYRPAVVFHAAALKHVPVLESFPEEAVATNVVGTRNVMEAGSLSGMERFVLISTDKAVNPSSIMGATKRVAEMLVQSATERADGCTYTAVRFGNVLGSRGSVVPTFVSQIEQGGPVTITDEAMTRYFMTVDEAVQLVLQAEAMAAGGEVFVLDMGEPVRIMDLARRLIRLAGLVPGRDVAIEMIGRRPGEKLEEILAHAPLEASAHPKIGRSMPPVPGVVDLHGTIEHLRSLSDRSNRAELHDVLHALASAGTLEGDDVIDLRPSTVVSWT